MLTPSFVDKALSGVCLVCAGSKVLGFSEIQKPYASFGTSSGMLWNLNSVIRIIILWENVILFSNIHRIMYLHTLNLKIFVGAPGWRRG